MCSRSMRRQVYMRHRRALGLGSVQARGNLISLLVSWASLDPDLLLQPRPLQQQLNLPIRLLSVLHDDGHLHGQLRLLSSLFLPSSSLQEAHKTCVPCNSHDSIADNHPVSKAVPSRSLHVSRRVRSETSASASASAEVESSTYLLH